MLTATVASTATTACSEIHNTRHRYHWFTRWVWRPM